MNFTYVVFQVQDDGAYPLGLDDPPDSIDSRIIPFYRGFVLYVDLKVGIDGVSVS